PPLDPLRDPPPHPAHQPTPLTAAHAASEDTKSGPGNRPAPTHAPQVSRAAAGGQPNSAMTPGRTMTLHAARTDRTPQFASVTTCSERRGDVVQDDEGGLRRETHRTAAGGDTSR